VTAAPSLPATSDELVTVVIPARNEERAISLCLDSVLAQTHQHLQVIVVDGASTDRTADVVLDYARRDPRVELLTNPDRIIPKSLNVALRAARSRWLVRVDAHAAIPADFVEIVHAHLATGRWGGVGGRKDGMGRTAAGRAIAAAMGSRFGVGNSTYHYGEEQTTVDHLPFGAYPVELARSLGGWNEELVVNQDYEFDYRVRQAGHELLFDPVLRIEWECRQSIPDLFRQYRRYGRGKAKVVLLHPRSMRVRHAVAPAFVLVLAGAAVVAPRRPRVAAALVLPYLGALAAASASVAPRVAPGDRRFVAPAFLAMHVGWGAGFVEGFGRTLLTDGRPTRTFSPAAGDASRTGPAPVDGTP
jgi:cellulose synthase/poly-beta-1,6-N-acetylglucosamine synthase-like glycosyltransferase